MTPTNQTGIRINVGKTKQEGHLLTVNIQTIDNPQKIFFVL